ncbi:hypothetical protein GF356_05790 [candidate division GN15 bacterium]|nr:hypothetical protein [candidate division GN15 bacterium]
MTDSNDMGTASPEASDRSPVRRSGFLDRLVMGVGIYYVTSLIVIVAATFAVDFVVLCRDHPSCMTRVDVPSALAAWDGEWYMRIATEGYSYDRDRISSVGFFPLYPGLGGLLVKCTGLRAELALLVISHGALAALFVLMIAYVRRRFSSADEELAWWTLLAMGLFPTTFYFRMAYTESTFMLLMLLALYGIECKWRPLWIAALIGLATASRSAGVAMIPVFALHLWTQYPDQRRSWLLRVSCYLPVCCSGVLLYMVYQWLVFGEPLAFVQTQENWCERVLTLRERVVGLATLEPIRAVYDPTSPCYWARVAPRSNLLFNMKAANPVYVLATVGLVAFGARKRWLSANELVLAIGLLAIPIWFKAGQTCMMSQARYASVVFPVYLVLGQILHRIKPPWAAMLMSLSAFLLVVYTALFVSWYRFF